MYKCSYRKNSRSNFYESDDRIRACYKSLKLITKQYDLFLEDYITYTLFNSIDIFNMMILNDNYNIKLLQKVQKIVKKHIKSVKKSQYGLSKKMQIYLFYYNFSLYKVLYKALKIKGGKNIGQDFSNCTNI